MTGISVIIPTLNEEHTLPRALHGLSEAAADTEVIVADGGSMDATVALAEAFGTVVLRSPPGRARQMNAGASAARGDVFLFLHADTVLPGCFEASVRAALSLPGTVAGAFKLRIDGSSWRLRIVETLAAWRSRWFKMPYGDQAIFVTAELFRSIGGFPDLPIMEDFVLVKRLHRAGRIAVVPAPVLTSARRWMACGVFRTTVINQLVIAGYALGVSPSRLATLYRRGQAP